MQNSEEISILTIFDESGSMSSLGNEPSESLNSFYEDQKKLEKSFKSTLLFFNDKIKFIHKNIDGNEVPLITKEIYKPSGMTALLDAIGEGIEYQKSKTLNNVIVVILTDGHENSSNKHTTSSIRKLVTTMEKEHNWKFIYLGAIGDAFTVGNRLGIRTSHDYDATNEGLRDCMTQLSQAVSHCISRDVPTKNLEVNISNSKSNNPESLNLSSFQTTTISVEPSDTVIFK
jgi:hypothetical protein